jgi:hypothetical protein
VGLGLVAVLLLAGGISLFWSYAGGTATTVVAEPELAEPPLEPAAPPDTNPLNL